jgi:hypothetical protein
MTEHPECRRSDDLAATGPHRNTAVLPGRPICSGPRVGLAKSLILLGNLTAATGHFSGNIVAARQGHIKEEIHDAGGSPRQPKR